MTLTFSTHPAYGNVFCLQVGVKTFAAKFSSPAALLESAERAIAGGRDRVINSDSACLQ